MKRFLLIVAILLTGSIFILAQPTQEWVQTFSAPASATTKVTALDNAGNIYCAGRNHDGTTGSILLLKYDPAGNLLWSQTNSGGTSANSIVVDGNGEIIVVGSIGASGSVLIKYDASGSVIWTQTTTLNSSNATRSVTVDGSNNIYFYGYSPTSSPKFHQTIKFNSSGVQQWAATYNEILNQNYGGNNRATSVTYRNGFVYVTGTTVIHPSGTTPGTQRNVILTMKYNALNGAQVWAVTYLHADKKHQHGVDLAADGSGNLYVTGTVEIKAGSNANPNWVTLKYNPSGVQQWVKLFDGSANDYQNIDKGIYNGFEYPTVMTMDPGGNVIVTGTSYETNGSFTSQNMTTVKYSPTGTQLWARTYDGPTHWDDYGKAISTDTSANIYVTGPAQLAANPSPTNAVTIKYNSSGIQQWLMTYDGGASVADNTAAVGIDGTSNVYAAGASGNSSVLIKYSQGGPITQRDLRVENEITKVGLYPNPTTDKIFIRNKENKMLGKLMIYDATGRMVYQTFTGNAEMVIELNKFLPGVYILKTEESTKSIKFIKQ